MLPPAGRYSRERSSRRDKHGSDDRKTTDIEESKNTTNTSRRRKILLEVRNLKKYFQVRTGFVKKTDLKAVDDVSFFIRKGETLGIVGESGCGKTTLGRTILRLEEPTSGEIIYNGDNIIGKDMKEYRRHMQIVFQDPYASLDPRKTVSDIIGEAMDIHQLYSDKNERRDKILELMKLVGLNAEFYNRFPHEFSGGQRQRIGIARALAVDPGFIVCDEPVSALDVSIQAQIINMLEDLQKERQLTYLFIAHDLAVVKHISTRIGRHVSGTYGGAGCQCGAVSESAASLYTDASVGHSDCRSGSRSAERHGSAGRGDPKSPQSAVRLSFPYPCARRANQLCREYAEAAGTWPGHLAACHML